MSDKVKPNFKALSSEAGLTEFQVRKLMSHPAVADVENEAMDEGRFFVHLDTDHEWPKPYHGQHTKSFGSYDEAAAMLKRIVLTPKRGDA